MGVGKHRTKGSEDGGDHDRENKNCDQNFKQRETAVWMLDAGWWFLDAGFWMLDTGCLFHYQKKLSLNFELSLSSS
jgi:hypothetical protein